MKRAVLVGLASLVACGRTPPTTTTDAAPSVSSSIASAPPRPRAPLAAPSSSSSRETLAERAARIHRDAFVIDAHDDIPSVMIGARFDLATPNGNTHTDLPRMKAGGVTAEFFSIYVDKSYAEHPGAKTGGSARRALDLIDVTYQQIERHSGDLVLATRADDIRAAKRDGKIAIMMGIEGGHAIENSLFALREFYRLGVRYMTLTHTNTNDWADSAGFFGPPPTKHHGLTAFGEKVVHEMQRIGMLVDISHVSDETFFAVMKIAKAPVIASHSSSRKVAEHRRNLSDDMLRAIATNGGVAMVNFWSAFIDPKYVAARARFMEKNGKAVEALREKYKDDRATFRREMDRLLATEPLPETPLSVLIDHIDHMIEVAGPDHVGLGSDFDGVDALPKEITGIDGLPKITYALLERGHSEEVVRKVLGGNFLRVLDAAEAYARGTSTTLSGDGDVSTIP